MLEQLVQKWLDYAKWAASGGNSQAWRVEYYQHESLIAVRLSIELEYQKKPSAMDIEGMGSVMSLGCLAFNIQVLAQYDGYILKQTEYDIAGDLWKSSVTLFFGKAGSFLGDYEVRDILNRRTDRTPYSKQEITEYLQSSIQHILQKYPDVKLMIFDKNKSQLKPMMLVLEKIRWSNSFFRNSLLSEIVFGHNAKLEDDKIHDEELGISFFEKVVLQLFKGYKGLHLLLPFGLDRFLTWKSVKNYIDNCHLLFFMQSQSFDFRNSFELGQCFQELWVEVNRNGVSLQPFAGSFIAFAAHQKNCNSIFTSKELSALRNLTQEVKHNFSVDFTRPTIGFRVGWPLSEVPKSTRKKLFAIRRS